MTATTNHYRPSNVRATLARIGLGAASLAALAAAAVSLGGLALVDRAEDGSLLTAEALGWDSATSAASGIQTLVTVVTAFLFIAWLSRSVDNVPAIGGGTPGYTPRAAIYWWFVPVASFIKPLRVVTDLADRTASSARPIATAWWILFMGSNIVTYVASRLPARTTGDLRRTILLTVGTELGWMIAGVVAIVLVTRLERGARAMAAAGPGAGVRESLIVAATSPVPAPAASISWSERVTPAPAASIRRS